jgi:hypothetical protein
MSCVGAGRSEDADRRARYIVRSADDLWTFAVGELCFGLRRQSPFAHGPGNTIRFQKNQP